MKLSLTKYFTKLNITILTLLSIIIVGSIVFFSMQNKASKYDMEFEEISTDDYWSLKELEKIESKKFGVVAETVIKPGHSTMLHISDGKKNKISISEGSAISFSPDEKFFVYSSSSPERWRSYYAIDITQDAWVPKQLTNRSLPRRKTSADPKKYKPIPDILVINWVNDSSFEYLDYDENKRILDINKIGQDEGDIIEPKYEILSDIKNLNRINVEHIEQDLLQNEEHKTLKMGFLNSGVWFEEYTGIYEGYRLVLQATLGDKTVIRNFSCMNSDYYDLDNQIIVNCSHWGGGTAIYRLNDDLTLINKTNEPGDLNHK